MVRFIGMVGQPHQNFMKMASWSSVSEHLVNPIGMSDQLKWNNHFLGTLYNLALTRHQWILLDLS